MSKVYLCRIFRSAIYDKCLKFCTSQFVKWMEIKWQRKDMMQTNFHGDLVSFFLCPFIDKLIVFRFCRRCWNAHDTEFLHWLWFCEFVNSSDVRHVTVFDPLQIVTDHQICSFQMSVSSINMWRNFSWQKHGTGQLSKKNYKQQNLKKCVQTVRHVMWLCPYIHVCVHMYRYTYICIWTKPLYVSYSLHTFF